MTKDFCDICGREVCSPDDATEYKIKVKYKWYLWYEYGWERVTLCNDCKKSFHEYWKKVHK